MSFPFPPGSSGITPQASVVLLAGAIYEQLPRGPDGRVTVDDVKGLLRRDATGDVAVMLGIASENHSAENDQAAAADPLDRFFHAYGFGATGAKISREELELTLQSQASAAAAATAAAAKNGMHSTIEPSLHLPPISMLDGTEVSSSSPSSSSLLTSPLRATGGSSLLLPTTTATFLSPSLSNPTTPTPSVRTSTPRSVRDSPVPPLPAATRRPRYAALAASNRGTPVRRGMLPPPPPKNPPPQLPGPGQHTVSVLRTAGSAPSSSSSKKKKKNRRRRRSSSGLDFSRRGGNVRPDVRGRYAEVLQEDPNNIDALEHIGYFFVKSQQPKKALDALNRAHRLGCDNGRLWESTGRAHFLLWRQRWRKLETELGSTEVALKRILDEMPSEAHLETSYQAYERCTQFTSFDPDSNFWYELAEVYFHYEAYEGTLAMLSNLTRDDPNFPKLNEVIAMVGTVYFRLGHYAESIHCWKRVLHSPPEHMKERHVLFVLARLHELNGDSKAAQECFEEVYDFVRKFNLQVSAEQYSRVKSTREYVADADTWLDHARVLMRRGYYVMVEDTLRVALEKQRDQDAAHGVLDYPKENLKEIWVALARSHCFRLDADQALHALIKAQEARPYDYYVRQSLMDIDPAPEKWSDLFVMESAYALILTRLVRGFLERQRLRRERRVMGDAATKMARIFRGVRWRIRLKGMYLQLVERRSRVRKRRNWAIMKMQSIGRMIKMRNEFIDYKHAALVISSGVRGMIGRTRAMRRRNEIMEAIRRRNNRAATTVQACARGFALRTHLNRQWAAIDIQALARGYVVRRRVNLAKLEPQLVATSRSGFPRGTPGHRRHWQRRLEQCEFLFSDRMELRRHIGKLTSAHPCLTPHEAFLAIAETAGDLQFATQLLNQEPDFADELYEMSRVIDVDKYIALRPAPVLGPVAAKRRQRTLSRRWTEALSTSYDRRSTHILVEEIAQREDPAYNYFLSRADKYTTDAGPGLPWHKENTKGAVIPRLLNTIAVVGESSSSGAGSTRQRRGLLFSMQKSLKPERIRTFSPHMRGGHGGSGFSARGGVGVGRTGDRLFAPVSLTQNVFHDMMLDANHSAVPRISEEAAIGARLDSLQTNPGSVGSLTGASVRGDHVEGVTGLVKHDASNARRSPLRKAMGKSVTGRLSRKHIAKQARRRAKKRSLVGL